MKKMVYVEDEVVNFSLFGYTRYRVFELTLDEFVIAQKTLSFLVKSKLFKFVHTGLPVEVYGGRKLLFSNGIGYSFQYELTYPIGYENIFYEKKLFVWFAITQTNNRYYDYDEENKIFRMKEKYRRDKVQDFFN